MTDYESILELGWRPFFQQQLTLDELTEYQPARVIERHRSLLVVATGTTTVSFEIRYSMPEMVVGDWLLLDHGQQFARLLDRSTCFKRKAPGSKLDWQLIAANVDTAFILCSLNDDFNLNRLERYLSLVHESGAMPVVVLTKADLVDDPSAFVAQVQQLDSLLAVEVVNCLDTDSTTTLSPWLKTGETVVVLGSSGVGKSTLINTLLGENKQKTGGIREDDAKGRHTTTSRSLIAIPGGGLILDTPGMRELQLADVREGIAATFADIETLAGDCRYADCQHQSEPGCAVKRAVESGELEQRRLDSYLKLRREEALNSASLSEKRAQDKALGKFYKRTLKDANKLKGR